MTFERKFFKPVFRYDQRLKKVRLFRLLWERGIMLNKGWYSAMLAVSLVPRLIGFEREFYGWRVTLCGIQIHHKKAYGGVIV